MAPAGAHFSSGEFHVVDSHPAAFASGGRVHRNVRTRSRSSSCRHTDAQAHGRAGTRTPARGSIPPSRPPTAQRPAARPLPAPVGAFADTVRAAGVSLPGLPTLQVCVCGRWGPLGGDIAEEPASLPRLRAPGLWLVGWNIPPHFPRRRHVGSLEGMAVPGRWVPDRGHLGVTFSLSSCHGDTKAGLGSLGCAPNPFRDMV